MAAKILIVDDNPANLDLLDYLLRAAGHVTSTAINGREGLELALREPPDLIICDLQMPYMDGFEVLRQLRQTFSTAALPVIAVTALSMPGDQQKVLEAGFNGYISKPIEPEHFVQQIERHLSPDLRSTGSFPFR